MLGAISGNLSKIRWRFGEGGLRWIVVGLKRSQDGFVGVSESREKFGGERWLDILPVRAILVLR